MSTMIRAVISSNRRVIRAVSEPFDLDARGHCRPGRHQNEMPQERPLDDTEGSDVTGSIAVGLVGPEHDPRTPSAANQTMPSSSAFRTARVRSRTPSFDRMLETWFFTVPSATCSELAISLML